MGRRGYRVVAINASTLQIRLVDQDRLAGQMRNRIITFPAIGPDTPGDSGTNDDLVVSIECIDDNGQEVTFGRQQTLQSIGADIVDRRS